jgi:hypothetical protein
MNKTKEEKYGLMRLKWKWANISDGKLKNRFEKIKKDLGKPTCRKDIINTIDECIRNVGYSKNM